MQRPGWSPCASSAVHSQTTFLNRGVKMLAGNKRGMSGRQVQSHLLLKVRMVWMDGADSSRRTVPGTASLQKPYPE